MTRKKKGKLKKTKIPGKPQAYYYLFLCSKFYYQMIRGEVAEMLIHTTLKLLRFFRVVEAAQEKAIPEQRGRYLVDQ